MNKFSVIVWMLYISSVKSVELPAFIREVKCNVNHDLDKCFMESANKIIPKFAEGVPELHVPNLNPMIMEFAQLIDDPSLKLNISDIKIHGLKQMKVVSAKLRLADGIQSANLRAENLTIEGLYTVKGQIAVLPVEGQGHFSIYLKNGIFDVNHVCTTINKDGETYMKRLHTNLDFKCEKVEFNLENLFNGDEKLGNAVNLFLNENWDTLLGEYGPGILKLVKNLIENIFDNFVEIVPMKEFFDLN